MRCKNCNGQLIQKYTTNHIEFYKCVDCGSTFYICNCCARIINPHETSYVSADLIVCENCRQEYIQCRDCGTWVHRDSNYITISRWNNDYICMQCFISDYFECAECHEITHNYDGLSFHGILICYNCYHNCIRECANCGYEDWTENLCYDNNRDEYYCSECWNERNQFLHEYNFKPSPIFKTISNKDKSYYFGIELEIDDDGDAEIYPENLAEHLYYEFSEDENLFYCKHDGSLSNGLEIVSQPCSFNFHLQQFPWKEIFKYCLDNGYTSHDPGTCGLHIHIDRKSFGKNEKIQELNILKLVYLFEKNFDFFKRFSRRRNLSYCENYRIKDLKDCTETVKYHDKKCNGRYYAINLENYNTVEIRLWRGTLKHNTFIATLQFTKLLIDFVKEFGIGKIVKCDENDILSYVSGKYKELDTYLRERNLM